MKTYWPALACRPILRLACLLLVLSAAIATLWAGAGTSPAATATAAIAAVEVGHAGQQTTVRVEGNGPLTYRVLRLSDPPRLVVDFSNARLVMRESSIESSYVPVRGVRLGHPEANTVRVVIDLERFVPYNVQNDGTSFIVSFDATVPAGVTAAIPRKPAAHAAPAVPTMHLPAWLVGMDSGLAAPNDAPPPPQATGAATSPAVPAPQGTAAAPAAGPAPVAGKRYTGDPISVDLKDVDLKDFFRLIHEISGLNVVLDPAVHGSVTLVLDEVPWDQALDIVLQNNGLSSQIQGNVLRIETQDTLRREAETRRDLTRAQSDSVELVTETRTLSYGNATKLRDVLRRFLSPRGDIFSDDRTNTLIIRDVPSSLPSINDLIRQLDRKSQQVEIEARVVQATRSFARDIGTQFGFAYGNGNNVYGGLSSAGVSPLVHSIVPPLVAVGTTAQIPLSSNFPAIGPTSGFTFSNQSANFALDFMLSLMETKNVGKLLSEPEGVTQNNEKLVVKQGVQIPIQTNINNTISTQYVDAALILSVTPQITADGTVFLDVDVENTQIDSGVPEIQGEPALSTQSAISKVTVRDGGTVVIGGVIVSQQNSTINQVPLIGNIPVIGHLFKETSVNMQSQELLFFITPRILPD
ncbi:MAG: type IV pilus secretin PilQ [Candidatus Acidiferrales bacterium]